MARPDHTGALLGRRQFLHRLLETGAGIALVFGADIARQPSGTAAAGAPPPPPQPGAPPDKQGKSAVTVPADDPGLTAGMVEYPGVITPLLGYLSAPTGGEIYPGVLVLHDFFGLTEHYKDITRRLAKAGYVALAPDLLSRDGGTDKLGDQSRIQAALGTIAPTQLVQDLTSSVLYLESRPLAAKTRIGGLGIGLGGNLLWFLLTQTADLKAAVVYSANIPSTRVIPQITAAVLAIVGENERQQAAEISDFDAAMKKTQLPWAYKIEPTAGRGFFDDSHDRYVPAAAKDAWKLTLDWFTTHLTG